ncbi:uncharacterized protein LOC144827968 [Lissotriton helveticus]
MTVSCQQCQGAPAEGCQRPAHRGDPPRGSVDRPFRSTKGASKARRDLMNAEIRALRELLPLPAEQRGRLSYLHTMGLVCLRMRSQIFSEGAFEGVSGSRTPPAGLDPLPALPGFIMALSAQGKLVSITDNIVDYLGYTMVELLAQGDSLFDLIQDSEVPEVQRSLREAEGAPGSETSFVCHLQSEKTLRLQHGGDRAVLVRGRFLPSTAGATFLALCTPLEPGSEEPGLPHSASFRSQHTLDMRLTEVTDSVLHHLGYHPSQLIGRSWYSLLHPEDLSLGADRHRELMRGGGSGEVKFVVRMLSEGLTHTWVQVTATRERHGQTIGCMNRILSAEEACYLRLQHLTSSAWKTTTGSSMEGGQQSRPGESSDHNNWGTLPGTLKRKGASKDRESKRARVLQTSPGVSPRTSSLQSQTEDPCLDTSFAFTPPYTPESDASGLSGLTSSDSPWSDTAALPAESWDLRTHSSPDMYSWQVLADPLAPVRTAAAADRLEGTAAYTMVEPSLVKEDTSTFSSSLFHALVPDSLLSPHEEDALVAESDFYPNSAEELEGFLSSPGDHGLPTPFTSPHDAYQELGGERSMDTTRHNFRASPPGSGKPQYMDHEWQEISLLASQLRCMAESFSAYSRPAHQGLQVEASPSGWGTSTRTHHGDDQDPTLDESAITSILMDLCNEGDKHSAPVAVEERGGSCTVSLYTPEGFPIEAPCAEGYPLACVVKSPCSELSLRLTRFEMYGTVPVATLALGSLRGMARMQ